MAQYTRLQERIKEIIRPNGVGAITAADHQALLLEIVDTLGYDINRIGDGAVKPDGKYPELTAGFANNLVGRGEAIEAEFSFRPSGGKSIEDGVARVKELRGNTIVVDGAFLSCKADAIKTVGFNAWDEEWENGYIESTTGEEIAYDQWFRCKNYIKILPNTQYYAKKPSGVFMLPIYYDEEKRFIKSEDVFYTGGEGGNFTTPNASYMRFYCNIPKYNGDICINISHTGYRNGEYQPYMQFIREFDRRIMAEFPNGLQIGDKVYNKNGQGYIQKGTGVLSNMADLDWSYITGDGRFSAYVTGFASPAAVTDKGNIACVPYATLSALDTYNGTTGISIDGGRIWLRDNSLNGSVAALKNKLQGAELYYEVADPTILEYDEPFNLDYEVWDFGTEEMLASEPSAPIRGLIAYGFNAVDEIRELRQMLTTLQATIANL